MVLWCTFFYFAWLVLDNIDGKQARRTSSSSPLGLIMDHQVDALNVTIAATFLGTTSLYGNSAQTMVMWLIGAIPFFFATWEELMLGSMNFPMINGACDGCLLLGFTTFAFGFMSIEYFYAHTLMGINLVDCTYYFFLIGAIFTGLYK